MHYPNVDGLNWFLTDLINRFSTIPFKKLYVTGRWSKKTIRTFREKRGFVDFIGFVDDLAPYLANCVSIVPIRIGGGGIRTKILTAMMYGAPVVTTSIAAVGIKGEHGKELLISDSADDFVNSIIELFENREKSNAMIKKAYELVKREYSQTSVAELRNRHYTEMMHGNVNRS
jgi:glycosyltransferase involved in cell wall biosynthesis